MQIGLDTRSGRHVPWHGTQQRERRPGTPLVDTETMRQNKYALTAEQFQALRQKLEGRVGAEKFDEDNVEAAHAVMVKGEPVTKAADAAGCSRQNLHRVIRDLMAVFHDIEPPSRGVHRQKTLRTPANWVRIAVTVPPEMAKTVQEMESKARAQLEQGQNSEREQA